jgi:hypothetical protein
MTFVVCKEQYNRSSAWKTEAHRNFYVGEKYEIQKLTGADHVKERLSLTDLGLARLIFHHGGHVYVDLEDLEKHFCSIEEWREIQLNRLID